MKPGKQPAYGFAASRDTAAGYAFRDAPRGAH